MQLAPRASATALAPAGGGAAPHVLVSLPPTPQFAVVTTRRPGPLVPGPSGSVRAAAASGPSGGSGRGARPAGAGHRAVRRGWHRALRPDPGTAPAGPS